LLLLFLFPSDKIIAHIEVYTSKEIVRIESAFMIVVSMEDSTHPGIPAAIVPHNTETADTVDVHIVERKVTQ
jgi:hypothetical protein